MLKRCVTILLLLLTLTAAFPLIARADVISEPDNTFFRRNRNRCTPLERSFCANGKNGSVSLKEAPGSKKETGVVANGESIYILTTYNDKGKVWGFSEYPQDGWVPMDELLLIYDYISFAEEHGNEFYTYTGNLDALPEEPSDIVLWKWPGSGKNTRIDEPTDVPASLVKSNTYKDEQGREWIFMSSYYYEGWICISDPTNTNIPAFNPAPEPMKWGPEGTQQTAAGWESHDIQPAPAKFSLPVSVIIITAVLVICTAILIGIFWKKNTTKRKPEKK